MKDKKSLLSTSIQRELIPSEELSDGMYEEEESKVAPKYTAERFSKKRAEDYQRCIALLAAGVGLLKIARLLRVHHMTVAAVRDVEGVEIDIVKQRIKSNLRLAIEVGAERLAEEMAALPAGQLPVATAVLVDKLAQLEGEPVGRIEHTHRVVLTHEGVMKDLSAFPATIDVGGKAMVCGEGGGGEKGAQDGGRIALPCPADGEVEGEDVMDGVEGEKEGVDDL